MTWLVALGVSVTIFFGSLFGGVLGFFYLSPIPVVPTSIATTTRLTEESSSTSSSSTLTTLSGYRSMYAKDAKHVYIGVGRAGTDADLAVPYLVSGLDPTSFLVIDQCYSKDNFYVYYTDWTSKSGFVDGADPNTFRLLPGAFGGDGVHSNVCPLYAEDIQHVYFSGVLIKGADPATFVILNDRYSKDAKNVYIMTNMIVGADVASFTTPQSADVWYGQDKNYTYRKGQIVQ